MKPLVAIASLLLLAACADTGTATRPAPAPTAAQAAGYPAQSADSRAYSATAPARPQATAEVRDAQEHLRMLGLYDGAVDGIWGPETQAAVVQFQREQGIERTARLDDATQRAIRDEATLAQSEPITLTEPTQVRALQNRLRQLGYFDGRADGVWGPTTQVALESFQQARGLQVGQVTEATLSAMGLDPADFPTQTAAERSVGGDVLEPRVVRRIQQRLRELGFYEQSVDGVWGPATQAAVVDFQRSRGLEAHGQLNPTTASALGLDPNNLTASAN